MDSSGAARERGRSVNREGPAGAVDGCREDTAGRQVGAARTPRAAKRSREGSAAQAAASLSCTPNVRPVSEAPVR